MALGRPKLQLWEDIHSLGIQTVSIRNIQAIRFLVHSQIFRPSPHSMILWMTVSCSPQLEQRGEPASPMACSLSFMGRMSWMTLNQLTLIESAAHVAWRFSHTRSQSVVGNIIVMRTFLSGIAASLILRSVSYTLALKVRGASPYLGGSTYALSMAYIRKYFSLLGIPSTWGGFPYMCL
jgi:hypothetical protein